MSADGHVLPQSGASASQAGLAAFVREHWALLLGFGFMAIPTIIRLAEQNWPMEIGAHGPIVLATGIWLFFHVRGDLLARAAPAPAWLVALVFAASIPVYVFGRAYDLPALEAGGLYLFFLAASMLIIGPRSMIASFFPFFYLAFLIPVPGWLLDQLTLPLQHFVSWISTAGLAALGYPIAREGIVIFIAQYQLLVEDACSGMNSLIGLTAVMLFYIYIIHRASFLYALFLGLAILPIAVITNIIRVTALILLTYYEGDEVAQGFLHVTTGVVLFAMALGLTILLDKGIQAVLARRRTGGPSDKGGQVAHA